MMCEICFRECETEVCDKCISEVAERMEDTAKKMKRRHLLELESRSGVSSIPSPVTPRADHPRIGWMTIGNGCYMRLGRLRTN